jgi:hypothetical protein
MLLNPFCAQHAAQKLRADPEYRLMAPVYQWWLERRAKSGYEPAD